MSFRDEYHQEERPETPNCYISKIVPFPSKGEIPGPLPLGVAVIDASVILFGYIIPHVADKHKLKIMDHFGECIRQAKSARQQAIQINVFAAVLSALKVSNMVVIFNKR